MVTFLKEKNVCRLNNVVGLISSGYLEYGFLLHPKITSVFREC